MANGQFGGALEIYSSSFVAIHAAFGPLQFDDVCENDMPLFTGEMIKIDPGRVHMIK